MAKLEDDELGAHVSRLRASAGITLEDVAQAMSDRGYGWTQSTAWKIEHGQRSLKANEVPALVEVLDVGAVDLLTVPTSRAQRASDAAGEVVEAAETLAEAVRALVSARYGWVLLSDEDREAMEQYSSEANSRLRKRSEDDGDLPSATAVVDAMTVKNVVEDTAKLMANQFNAGTGGHRKPETFLNL